MAESAVDESPDSPRSLALSLSRPRPLSLFPRSLFLSKMSTSNFADHREEDDVPAGDDEDTGAPVAPIVRLKEVAISNGEEYEETILDLKAKLYRFDRNRHQWKERGEGTVKFLRHKFTGIVRLLMRQSKTLKICANHLISANMSVQEHAVNEKSCVWHAWNYCLDGELEEELFCIRFTSIENCRLFMETFHEIAESQNNVDNHNADAAAGLLENLQVEESADGDATAALVENLQVEENAAAGLAESLQVEGNADAAAGLAENLQVEENADVAAGLLENSQVEGNADAENEDEKSEDSKKSWEQESESDSDSDCWVFVNKEDFSQV